MSGPVASMQGDLAQAPRRILMTADAVGGVWRYAMDLGKALGERGVEVVLAVFGPAASDEQRREANHIAGLRLVEVDEPLDWLVASESELDGIPSRIARLAAEHRVELLHLNLPSQAYRLRADIPVVVASHSCVVTWWHAVKGGDLPDQWRWQKARNRGGFDAADLVLVPSRSQANMLQACYRPIERLRVVHNATAINVSSVRKEPFVLAAARWWDEGKNAAVLDEAARETAWPVLMAGALEGPQGQTVEIRHANALGELSSSKIRQLMARASIVVSPSRYEPFGLVALEAASAGAALVLADVPTYRELWDGAALFVHPDDGEEFAAAINRLAADTRMRTCLGQAATLRAAKFSPNAQVDAMLDAYRAATSRSACSLALAG